MPKTTLSIKEKLHERINRIDDENVLEVFYTILGNYKNEALDYKLTSEQLVDLQQREADYLSGKEKGSTLEEYITITKEKYGF